MNYYSAPADAMESPALIAPGRLYHLVKVSAGVSL
jgi:hypothetical protein